MAENWRLLSQDPVTKVQTWGWYEPDGKNPDIGKLHVKEVLPAYFLDEVKRVNHHLRSEFKGYKDTFTTTASIPEDIYWKLRRESGDDGKGWYDHKYFQKKLREEFPLLRTDKGGRI